MYFKVYKKFDQINAGLMTINDFLQKYKIAIDVSGCSHLASLLSRPPPTPETRVERDPLHININIYIYIYIYIYTNPIPKKLGHCTKCE